MNAEKVKEYFKENWKSYAKGAVIGLSCGICYNVGYKACADTFTRGLRDLCLVDPELKTRILDADKLVKDRIG